MSLNWRAYRVSPGAKGGGEDGGAVLCVPGLQAALPHSVDGQRVDAVDLQLCYVKQTHSILSDVL